MKKSVIVFLALVFICGNVFAMGSRSNLSPLAKCYADADKLAVPLCGDPMFPNFPHSVASQSNVTGVTYLKNADGTYTWNNPAYDPNKKTYDPVCFSKTTAPAYTACRAKFQS